MKSGNGPHQLYDRTVGVRLGRRSQAPALRGYYPTGDALATVPQGPAPDTRSLAASGQQEETCMHSPLF